MADLRTAIHHSRGIVLFLVLTAALSSISYAFIIFTGHVGGGNGTYELGLGSVALAVAGIRPAPGIQTAAYVIVWLTGYGGFPDPKFVFFTPATGLRGSKTFLAIDEFGFALPAVGMLLVAAFCKLARKQDLEPNVLS